jgi:hypothetical protein
VYVESAATIVNIRNARSHFEKLVMVQRGDGEQPAPG